MSLSVKGIVGEMSVGEMSVGEVSVEDRSQCQSIERNIKMLEMMNFGVSVPGPGWLTTNTIGISFYPNIEGDV